jgi:hypothetical protein
MANRELQGSVLAFVLLATLVFPPSGFAQRSALGRRSSSEDQRSGTVVSVRKVTVGYHPVTRYPQIHYYRLYLTVRVAEQTYCGEYETPVIEEIDDLLAAKGREILVVLNGKMLTVQTPRGRKLRPWLSEPGQC